MNILFLNDQPIDSSKGGIERVTMILSDEFRKKGHRTAFFTFPYFTASTVTSSLRFAKKIMPDVVINQSATNNGLSVAECLYDNGFKIISVIHNQPFPVAGVERECCRFSVVESFRQRLLRMSGIICPSIFGLLKCVSAYKIYSRLHAISERLVVLSSVYRERLIKFAPRFENPKVVSIPNPVSFVPYVSANKEKLVLWIGRHSDPQKNGCTFIEAWRLFSRNHPEWRAIMAGDGPQHAKYVAHAQRLRVERLEFVGNVTDVARLYRRASMLVMTSLYEGWPMVIPEAMAHGCVPVVFNTFEALEEILGEDPCGLSVDRLTPESLSEAMSSLANDEKLYCRLRKLALRPRPEWSPETIAGQWLSQAAAVANGSCTVGSDFPFKLV